MNLSRLGTAAAATSCPALLPLLAASPAGASNGSAVPDRPLRQRAADDHLRVGTAVDMSALGGDAAYRRLTGSEFSTATPENVMKWESVEPRQGEYNDYNTEWAAPKSDAVHDLLSRLRADGVPVDGVGFQGHLSIRYDLPTGMAADFARFDGLGLDTAVTEADVRMAVPADDTKPATQAEGYRRLLDACLRTRHCVSFTVWGFTDRYGTGGPGTPPDRPLRPGEPLPTRNRRRAGGRAATTASRETRAGCPG
ncbi:endo-1,4-beta-xylanase [Streptomyces sp. NPDC058294]|uniref:endo-1,4-beta-xylanase n=1 Tax=Streptomyces sp. NPDC058294 TaxID=3346430 RepID=UPI0036F026BB